MLGIRLIALAAGGLAACATPAPRVEEVGPNSYMVTVLAAENPDGKKLARLQGQDEAARFCRARAQHASTTHITGGVSDYIQGGEVEVNFRCVDEPLLEP